MTIDFTKYPIWLSAICLLLAPPNQLALAQPSESMDETRLAALQSQFESVRSNRADGDLLKAESEASQLLEQLQTLRLSKNIKSPSMYQTNYVQLEHDVLGEQFLIFKLAKKKREGRGVFEAL